MNPPREVTAASLLNNGQVLVIGGFVGGPTNLASAEFLQ